MKMLLLALLLFAQRPPSTALQTGTITGRLLNEDGTPAVKVRVSAMAIPEARNAGTEAPTLMTLTETDSAGRYRLADVPVGRYYVVAGFVDSPTYYPRGTGPSGATPVNVTFNATTANIDFRIERPSTGLTVSGRVISEASSPFGSIQIFMSGNSNGTFSNFNILAKPDGSFEFLRVRPGTYTLSVNPSPFPEQRTIVVADKDVTGLEVRLPWTGEVSGRVVVEGGGPAPSLTGLFSSGGRSVNAYIGAGQPFRATLPEGFFAFTTTGLPSGFYVKSVTSGSTDLLSTPLTLNRTALPPEILVTLGISTPSPWVKLNGRVKGFRSGATVSLSISGPTGSLTSPIAADGSFEFLKVLPGTYNASFVGVGAPGLPGQQVTLIVPNRDVAGLEFALPVMREVSGRVVVENGGPIPRPTLIMTPAEESPRSSVPATSPPDLAQLLVTIPTRGGPANVYINNLQENGTFKVSLPEGRYPLTVQLPAPGGAPPYSVKSLTYGSADLMKESITVNADNSSEIVVNFAPRSSDTWVKVTGRVAGLNPAVSNSATVVLSSSIFVTSLTTAIRPDGSFEFPKVYSGNYQARVNGVTSSAGLPPLEVNIGTSDVSGVELVVPREKELSGRIVLEGRGLLPRLNLPLMNTSGGMTGTSTSISVIPQADGTFKVMVPEGERQVGRPGGLPPGYSIKSIHYGSTDLAGALLKVAATDTAELRLTVTTPDLPSVKVRGKVTGLDAATLARGPINVTLNEPRYGITAQTALLADGSFEFPAVFPGAYAPRLSVALPNVRIPTVNVGSTDVTDVEIVVPRFKQIIGRITQEGSGPVPRFSIPLTSVGGPSQGQTNVLSILTQADSTFRVNVPEGEFKVGEPTGLPAGYAIKSMLYGSADLAGASLKVSATDTAELRLTVASAETARFKVSGKVTGLDPLAFSRGPVSVNLSEPRYATTLQGAVASNDASFQILNVPPGNYTARLTANIPNVGVVSLPVAVTASDVTNIEVLVPRQKEVSGRIVLEGSGAMPILFLPISSAGSSSALGSPAGSLTVSINARTDGSFRLTIPEGERRIGTVGGLPEGYVVKSIVYGTVDVRSAPLRIVASDNSELRITVSTPNHSPVKVSGRVTGLDALVLSRGPINVSMTAPGYAGNLQTSVSADGSFEFAEVFPGKYSARVVAPGSAIEPVAVAVANSDIRNVEIAMPGQKDIAGRLVIEGSAPLPRFAFRPPLPINTREPLAAQPIIINPGANGSFRLVLPEGQRPLGDVTGLPPGYSLKAATYGTTDLMREPLVIAKTDTAELVLTLSAPALKAVAVRGKVEGLDPSVLAQGIARVFMGSPTFAGTVSTPVKPDGSFEFPAIFQGNYVAQVSSPTLIDRALAEPTVTRSEGPTVPTSLVGIAAAASAGINVAVSDSDINDLSLSIPRQHLIFGHVEVLGGGPMLRIPLSFSGQVTAAGTGTTALLTFSPQADGTFRFTLPEGERFVSSGQLPVGYTLKSLTYGSVDLRQAPLKVEAGRPTSELRVTLEKSASASLVRVSGKVTGLPADAQNVRVGLVGAFNLPQEAPVNPDGTFTFPQVFQGQSSVRLLGSIGGPVPAPVPFIAGPNGATNLEIVIQH